MMVEYPFPQRKDDIIRGTRKHHFTRRCSAVWHRAYCILNAHDKIQAAIIYGPAPYPSVPRAFCKRPDDIPHHSWVQRMWGAGISSQQLDELIAFSHKNLLAQGQYWVHSLTNPYAYTIHASLRLRSKGFTGAVYHRNNYLYLGWAGRESLTGFIIDGQPVHIRQGRITLTRSNVREHHPHARSIRPLIGKPKQRWAYILHSTPREYQERLLLMNYQPQPYTLVRQPRLLTVLWTNATSLRTGQLVSYLPTLCPA